MTRRPNDTSRQLTTKQKAAIPLVAAGQSDTEVARRIGAARQTVNQWRHHSPQFVAALNAERQALWAPAVERLRSCVCGAVSVLCDQLESEDKAVRQRAAVHILKAAGLYGKSLAPHGITDADALAQRWGEEADTQEAFDRSRRANSVLYEMLEIAERELLIRKLLVKRTASEENPPED